MMWNIHAVEPNPCELFAMISRSHDLSVCELTCALPHCDTQSGEPFVRTKNKYKNTLDLVNLVRGCNKSLFTLAFHLICFVRVDFLIAEDLPYSWYVARFDRLLQSSFCKKLNFFEFCFHIMSRHACLKNKHERICASKTIDNLCTCTHANAYWWCTWVNYVHARQCRTWLEIISFDLVDSAGKQASKNRRKKKTAATILAPDQRLRG